MPGIVLAGSAEALDTSLNTIYSEFKLLRDETGVMRSVSTPMKLMPHEGRSKNVLNYGRVQAVNIGDGVDIAQAQSLSDAATPFSPGEVAVQVILAGSTVRRVADPDLLGRAGRILNNAYDLKEDADGCTQFSSFTPIIGAATIICSPGIMAAAAAVASVGNNRANPEPAPPPWYYVMHPLALYVVLGRLVPFTDVPTGTNAFSNLSTNQSTAVTIAAGANSMTETLLKEGIGAMGRFGGATVKRDANIPVDANDDGSGAFFSKEGVVYVSEVEPRLDPDSSDKSMRGAIELNLWGSYIYGLYRPGAYGCEILTDISVPTS